MSLSFTEMFKKLQKWFTKQTKKVKIIMLCTAIAVVLASVIITALLNSSKYVVLYRGLSSSEGVEVLKYLDSISATYKLRDDGTIMVLSEDEAYLKMVLASQGYPESALDYDIFTSLTDFMTTDYEQRQYLIFQLQNRLQSAIKTISGVKNAIVTISIPDNDSYVLKSQTKPVTASVVLTLYGSTTLSANQVEGIETLVATGVPGLDPENVAIVDGDGIVLNNNDKDNINAAASKIEITNSVNELYKQKIETLLLPIFGEGNISVAVNAVIDFDVKTSEEITYTPVTDENGIVSSQEYSRESTNGGTVASGVPGTASNTGVDVYQSGDEADGDSSASETATTQYLVNQLIKNITNDGGEVSALSVSVTINKSEISDADIDKYKEIVAYGVGINKNDVSVSAVAFYSEPEPEVVEVVQDILTQFIDKYLYYILAGAGVLLILFILLVFLLIHGSRKRKKALKQAERAEQQQESEGTDEDTQQKPGGIVLNETKEQTLKKYISDFASKNPEIVAQLIRTWLNDDNKS